MQFPSLFKAEIPFRHFTKKTPKMNQKPQTYYEWG